MRPKVNILLVDDRWENLVSLRAALDDPGYNLVKACSGREALKLLMDQEFALILLDVQMPILNGFETAALIKERERTRDIPIIFITGVNIDEPFVYQGYGAGAVDYLCKPFDPAILRSKVAVFADLYRKTAQIRCQEQLLREAELRRRELQGLERERAAYQKYRDLVDGINHGIVWAADASSLALTFVSARIAELLGVPSERCLWDADFWVRHLPPDDRERVLDELRRAAASGRRRSFEHRLVDGEGRMAWFQTTVRISRGSGEGASELQGLSVDITHLKRAEAALQQSEQRARFLAETTRLVCGSLDYKNTLQSIARMAIPTLADFSFFDIVQDDGKIERVAWAHHNPSYEPLLAETAAITRNMLRPTHPVRQAIEQGKLTVAQSARPSFAESMAVSPRHLQILSQLGIRSHLTLPLTVQGRAVGALTLCCSDSNRRYSDSDVSLAEQVADRAALAFDNVRLYQDARAAVRARDEFLSIASHELKTPLTPLKLQLQGLARLVQRASPNDRSWVDKLPKILESSDRQINRLNRLVDELLDVSRINSGQLAIAPEEMDLVELARDLAQRFSHELQRAGCELVFASPERILGRWDRLRIEQVLTNLLSNAIRYAPGRPIHLTLAEDVAAASCTVRDHGSGISPQDQERIFRRFERAVPATNFGGLGLGLYIVHQILGAHGGSIRVESQAGQGAAFIARIPLRPAVLKAVAAS